MLYGATPIEDISYYNVIVRQLTEWTATTQHMSMDQTSIAEGIGGVSYGVSGEFGDGGGDPEGAGARNPGLYNVRQKYIHGIDLNQNITIATGAGGVTLYDGPSIATNSNIAKYAASGAGLVPNGNGGTSNVIPSTQIPVGYYQASDGLLYKK